LLSALGMVLSDIVKDYSQTLMLTAEEGKETIVWERFVSLQRRGWTDLRQEGMDEGRIALERGLDLRYVGQSYELTVLVDTLTTSEALHLCAGPSFPELLERFHALHRQRFGYAQPSRPVEIVNLRLRAVGQVEKPTFAAESLGGADAREAQVGEKPVWFAADASGSRAHPLSTRLYERDRLRPGHVLSGPAIVFEYDTTIVVPPRWTARVDGYRNLVAERTS
jgi:N-methylhydantoinase A